MAIVNMCVGCNSPINDMYHLIVGDQFYWHMGCLKCHVCHCMLQMEDKCYMNNGKFFCANDYTAFNQTKKDAPNEKALHCRKCTKQINSNDYVINISERTAGCSSLYHLNCFSCSECQILLSPGHPYGVYNQEIFCTQHYMSQLNLQQKQAEYTVLQSLNPDRQSSDCQINKSIRDVNISQQQVHNVTHHLMEPSSSLSLSSSGSVSSSCMSSSSSSSSSSLSPTSQRVVTTSSSSNRHSFKTKSAGEYPSSRSNQYLLSKKKRIRTSFKHQQLRIMKAHFQINQNPDSKDLKELSERTGLQKRVLQVWFQNSRAKQRKSSGAFGLGMHQLGQGIIGQSNGVSADSSINLEDDEAFSEEEEEEEGSEADEVCGEEKEGLMGLAACEGRFEQGQKQFTANSLVDFYHY